MPAAGHAPGVRSRLQRWLWLTALVVALVMAAVVLWLISGAQRDPTRSLHGLVGSAIWTTLGPHLALLSWAGVVVGGLAYWRGFGRFSILTLVLCSAAGLGSSLIVAAIVAAAVAAGGSANPVTGLWLRSMTADGPDQVVSYATRGEQPLRAAVYLPPPSDAASPVLLYVHGGGFKEGSFVETDADLRWFSQRGWLVFSVEYRLWTDQLPTWDLAPQDITRAAAWVRSQAAGYGGDMARFAMLGDSAGGNLAINVGYAAAAGTAVSDCGGAVPVPRAVVVQYPAVDPLAIYDYGYPVPGFEPTMLVRGYLGGDPHLLPERVQAVSSSTFITADAPATLVIAPEQDGLVPSSSVIRFAEQARAAGVEVELVRIPFASHVYNQMAANSLGNQARLSITARYLREQGLAASITPSSFGAEPVP